MATEGLSEFGMLFFTVSKLPGLLLVILVYATCVNFAKNSKMNIETQVREGKSKHEKKVMKKISVI